MAASSETLALVGFQVTRELGMGADHRLAPGRLAGPRLDFAEDLRGQGGIRADHAAALAGGAGGREERLQPLAHALARHLHEPQLRDLEDIGARLVVDEGLHESGIDLITMLRPLHVDEVDDDDAAQVAQADLAHHLHRGLEVDLEHGLLEVALAHVLPRVDVDGHQGFRVVDDDVAAGLEPHAAPQRLVDLLLDARGLEDRRGLLPELDARGQLGHEGLREVQALLVGGGGVDEKLLHVRGEEIADHAEGQVHLLVEQGRRAGGFEAALHLAPEPGEELDVGRDLLGLLAFGDGADDEAAGRRGQRLDDASEALPLGVVVDAPGDAYVP